MTSDEENGQSKQSQGDRTSNLWNVKNIFCNIRKLTAPPTAPPIVAPLLLPLSFDSAGTGDMLTVKVLTVPSESVVEERI